MKAAQQLTFKGVNGWGGRRRRAGRPNRSGQIAHDRRDLVTPRTPLGLTLRLRPGCVDLRTREAHEAFKCAARRMRDFSVRVVHYSLLGNHLHLIVETDNNVSLARAMRSFGSSFGKAIRKLSGGTGKVFLGRFHMHVLKTPAEVKRGLAYVLLNYSRHAKLSWRCDVFSSASYFDEWKHLIGKPLKSTRTTRPWYLNPPRTWLLSEGWRTSRTQILAPAQM